MSNHFDPVKSRQTSPMGEIYIRAGFCARCGASVYVVHPQNETDKDVLVEPDPRGFAGERHSLTTFELWPDVPFCWWCVNERGMEGYDECARIAERNTRNKKEGVK